MGDILFLAHRVPFPPDRGDKMRSFHILHHLTRLAPVHLVAFADDATDIAYAEVLRPLVASMHVEQRTRSRAAAGMAALTQGRPVSLASFDSMKMHGAVERLLAEQPIDTIFAFSGQMAQFVPEPHDGRFVMDFVDMDSAKFAAYADRSAGPMRWLHAREAWLLQEFERSTAARADTSLFVSAAEAALFRERTGAERVDVLENGIDLEYYDPLADFARLSAQDHGPGPLILFTGQMDYRPNVEAVESFALDSFPAILRRVPAARFAIVGRNPDPAVRRLSERHHVIVTGGVADVRSWLAAADVVVAPLRLARGVQNKVLEAMAMVRPVVASPDAFEGIDATPGVHLVVAGENEEADAVAGLLGDRVKARSIAGAARARVEARYGWRGRLASLASLVGREEDESAPGAAA